MTCGVGKITPPMQSSDLEPTRVLRHPGSHARVQVRAKRKTHCTSRQDRIDPNARARIRTDKVHAVHRLCRAHAKQRRATPQAWCQLGMVPAAATRRRTHYREGVLPCRARRSAWANVSAPICASRCLTERHLAARRQRRKRNDSTTMTTTSVPEPELPEPSPLPRSPPPPPPNSEASLSVREGDSTGLLHIRGAVPEAVFDLGHLRRQPNDAAAERAAPAALGLAGERALDGVTRVRALTARGTGGERGEDLGTLNGGHTGSPQRLALMKTITPGPHGERRATTKKQNKVGGVAAGWQPGSPLRASRSLTSPPLHAGCGRHDACVWLSSARHSLASHGAQDPAAPALPPRSCSLGPQSVGVGVGVADAVGAAGVVAEGGPTSSAATAMARVRGRARPARRRGAAAILLEANVAHVDCVVCAACRVAVAVGVGGDLNGDSSSEHRQ